MNIETGAKLSETIGTVGELSTSHDEWREASTVQRATEWTLTGSHLGDYLKEPTTAR